MGYFGGVSWAILVAKICQMFPLAQPSNLLEYFFEIYANWQWPKPVHMGGHEPIAGVQHIWVPEIEFDNRNWNLPIMTPCYPSINTTFNVSQTSHLVIRKAFDRAKTTLQLIRNNVAAWSDLFVKNDFFSK